jgi:competence protein ComFC
MQNYLKELLDFLFPPRKGVLLLRNLKYEDFISLAQTAQACDWADCLFNYQHEFVREILWELKYHANPKAALFFAHAIYELLFEEISEDFIFSNQVSYILVPIPASEERKKKYGFNPPLLLAGEIVNIDNDNLFKVGTGILERQKEVPRQTDIKNRKERVANAKGVYRVKNKAKVSGQSVIVIDDVTTTGATLKDAKRALKEAGAKDVWLVAAAH